jgi:predicted RNA-binding Zn ribbon-like protein
MKIDVEMPALGQLRIVTPSPSLNFVNTVDPREGDGVDYIPTYAAFVLWAARANIVTREESARLLRMARTEPAQAQLALRRALTLREVLYRAFSALAARRRPEHGDLSALRDAFHDAIGRAHLQQRGHKFHWETFVELESISSRIVMDAIQLLERGTADRIKRCPGNSDCGWLFLDTSKNATRHWCSMAGCGNRAKARRHLRRLRARKHD